MPDSVPNWTLIELVGIMTTRQALIKVITVYEPDPRKWIAFKKRSQ